jgi:hypothetical protein
MESLVGKIRFMMQSVAAYTLSTFLQLLYFQILDFYGLHLQSRNVFTTLRPRRNSLSTSSTSRSENLPLQKKNQFFIEKEFRGRWYDRNFLRFLPTFGKKWRLKWRLN